MVAIVVGEGNENHEEERNNGEEDQGRQRNAQARWCGSSRSSIGFNIVGEIRKTFSQARHFLGSRRPSESICTKDRGEDDDHESRDGIKQDLERVIADDLAAGFGRLGHHGAETSEFGNVFSRQREPYKDKADFIKEAREGPRPICLWVKLPKPKIDERKPRLPIAESGTSRKEKAKKWPIPFSSPKAKRDRFKKTKCGPARSMKK
jgi:hypothetical protein